MSTYIKNLDLHSTGVWFPIAVGIVLFLFMLFMPKKLGWKEILFTFSLIGYITWMLDANVVYTLDLFDLGKKGDIGIGDMITLGIIPSSLAVIYLNFYKEQKKWVYTVLFTILSSLFEWGLVMVGYMHSLRWNPWFSIPVYLGMYRFVLPWILSLLRSEFESGQNKSGRNKSNLLKVFIIKQKAK